MRRESGVRRDYAKDQRHRQRNQAFVADKLLSGDATYMDVEAAFLECKGTLEAAYRILCRNLWFQSLQM